MSVRVRCPWCNGSTTVSRDDYDAEMQCYWCDEPFVVSSRDLVARKFNPNGNSWWVIVVISMTAFVLIFCTCGIGTPMVAALFPLFFGTGGTARRGGRVCAGCGQRYIRNPGTSDLCYQCKKRSR